MRARLLVSRVVLASSLLSDSSNKEFSSNLVNIAANSSIVNRLLFGNRRAVRMLSITNKQRSVSNACA